QFKVAVRGDRREGNKIGKDLSGTLKHVHAASVLDVESARPVTEAFGGAVLADQDAFGDLEAPVFHPQARHEVEGHAGLENGLLLLAERDGAFAPVRRVGNADRIAAAAVLLDAGALERAKQRPGNFAGRTPGARSLQAGF